MSETSEQTCPTRVASKIRFSVDVKGAFLLILAAWLMIGSSAQAEGPDDDYVRIFNVMQQAGALEKSGQAGPALTKYQQAQTALAAFQRRYPVWNNKVVSYRLNYLAEKIAEVSQKVPGSAQAAGAPSAAGGSMPQVKLLGAGSEPRKVLRLHPKPGDKQTLSMTMKMAMEVKVGELENPATKLPPINLTMEVTVKTVAGEGDIAYDIVMSDASVSDEPGVTSQIAEAMKSSLAGFKGLSGTGILSNRGLNKGIDIKLPANADPQMRQTMDQMKESFSMAGFVLPEEPVGAGGKWEGKMQLKSQGMSIDQTATYELVSLEGERVTTKSTVVQTAANQKIESPAMPGLKLDLKKMAGKGVGDVTFDLTQVLAVDSTIDFHTDFSMGMGAGAQKQEMTMKMDMNLHLEGK